MTTRFLLLAVFGLFSLGLFAQNKTIWLMNGKKVEAKEYKILSNDGGDSIMVIVNIKGKTKETYLDDVFSVVDDNGTETFVYNPVGMPLNRIEMKSYIQGMQDAKKVRLSPLTGIASGAISLGGAFIPPIEISNNGSTMDIPLGILVPASTIVVAGALGKSDKTLKKHFPDKMDDENYLSGCQETFRKKRLIQGVVGSVVGFAAGFIIAKQL